MISARNTRADSEEPQVKLCSVEKTLCSVVFDMTLVGTNEKTCVLSNARISQNYSEILSLTWPLGQQTLMPSRDMLIKTGLLVGTS